MAFHEPFFGAVLILSLRPNADAIICYAAPRRVALRLRDKKSVDQYTNRAKGELTT